ncbi:MAG: HAD family hydrolase [Haloarculaceae archaeon]
MTGLAVETVFLDLDGTLCAYRRDRGSLLSAAFDRLDVDPLFTVDEYRDRLFAQVVTDETLAERREAAFRDLAAERADDPALGRRLASVYGSLRDHGDVRPLSGALEAVESLADRYDLALVTNGGPETEDPKLSTLGLTDAFDAVVYGGYDAAPKPEPGPFHEALYRLDAAPARTVHVGDSRRLDAWGADAAGIRVALVGADGDTDVDYSLSSLGELAVPPWE